MQVLITTPNLNKMGGVANYYRVLRKYLPENVQYFMACRRDGEPAIRSVLRLFSDYFRFKKALLGYDLVHINPSLGSKAIIRDGLFVKAAKKQGKKVVVFVRGWDKAFEKRLRKRWLWLFKRYYFDADAFIVLAEEFKDSLQEMGYTGPIYTETTVVDDSVFQQSNTGSNNSEKSFNILFLTRIVKAKGIYETIQAYAKLVDKHKHISLTIAGDGDSLEDVKEQIRRRTLRNVNFTGFISGDTKQQAFGNADCYVFPTHGEGMPTSVLEAMAFGLPVITRPVGGLKDFFENGKMGYVTDSLDPQVYADLIEKLITNPQLCNQISEYNRTYAAQQFMASKVANRLKIIYEEVFKLNHKHISDRYDK